MGEVDGAGIGLALGNEDGTLLGISVGEVLGAEVGIYDGAADAATDGIMLGNWLGSSANTDSNVTAAIAESELFCSADTNALSFVWNAIVQLP